MPGLPVQKVPAAGHVGLPHVNYMSGLQQYPPPPGYPIPGQQPLLQNMYMQQPFNVNGQNLPQVHQSYH